ncbi:MAG: hypothetical protein HeimC2_19840 [Candidatus Heimdallarchaeota archaeon LC_2]|nr:MAG: hypothetical protein HeimC2_19840 [Candidatus Heimdallarchaeota archaeon LC_2]
MKLNYKLIKIAFITFYALSILLVPSNTFGEMTILPEVDGNGPQINGNLTAEWEDSVRFDTVFNGEEANVFIQVNGSHLFIGFNYTSSSPFISVNDTLPIGSDYNNATHDWLVLQFDNNLDREIIGTEDYPDDLLSVDQYRNETFDGFIRGNTTHPIVSDNSTIEGTNSTIGGTNEGTAFRSNYSEFVFINENDIAPVERFISVYEFTKPLASGDINGSDIDITKTNIVQFKLLYWMNQTANETIANSQSTEWFTMRLNDTGTGINTKLLNETKIDIFMAASDLTEFNAFNTILEQYGFNTEIHINTSNADLSGNDLSILLLGSTGFSEDEIQRFIDDVKIGGTLLIFLGEDATVSNAIAEKFGLSYLANNLIQSAPGINQSDSLLSLTFSDDLTFANEPSSVTNKSISSVNITTSKGFNISESLEKQFILSQDYHLYDLFNLPSETVYDENDDLIVDTTETNVGVSSGVALDFVKGGRAVIFPSGLLASNNEVIEGNFPTYLLRLLPWVSRTINTLQFEDMNINTNNVEPEDFITLSLNLTDGFGSVLPDSIKVNVTSKLSFGGNYINIVSLEGSGSFYTNQMKIPRSGFMTVETTAFLLGYGFVEASDKELVSEFSVGTFNDLSDLSYILVIFFLMTVAIVVIVYLKTK